MGRIVGIMPEAVVEEPEDSVEHVAAHDGEPAPEAVVEEPEDKPTRKRGVRSKPPVEDGKE